MQVFVGLSPPAPLSLRECCAIPATAFWVDLPVRAGEGGKFISPARFWGREASRFGAGPGVGLAVQKLAHRVSYIPSAAYQDCVPTSQLSEQVIAEDLKDQKKGKMEIDV